MGEGEGRVFCRGVVSSIVKVKEQGGVKALVSDGAALLNSRSRKKVTMERIPTEILKINNKIIAKYFFIKRTTAILSPDHALQPR